MEVKQCCPSQGGNPVTPTFTATGKGKKVVQVLCFRHLTDAGFYSITKKEKTTEKVGSTSE